MKTIEHQYQDTEKLSGFFTISGSLITVFVSCVAKSRFRASLRRAKEAWIA